MAISIVGAGYVGLVSAVCFASRGHNVLLSTEDCEKARLIDRGIPPFHETGLEETLRKVVTSGKLRTVVGREEALLDSNVTFIAVGTPSRPGGGIDLRFVRETSVKIGKALRKKVDYHLIVVRSTVVPGTTENVVRPTIEKHSRKIAGRDFGLVMQPEFLRQGSAVYDTLNPDRIIVGEHDRRSGERLLRLYRKFYGPKLPPTLRTNLTSAEMIKYASNSFLATKISIINEIANICEKVPGVDIVRVAYAMGLDPRIGGRFLNAGVGFGGSCLPKDLNAIVAFAKERHYRPRILEQVSEVNTNQATHLVKLIKKKIGSLKRKKIALLGLSFKPGTDDLREAPSIRIIGQLLRDGAKVLAYDPVAINNAREIFGNRIQYADSAKLCVNGADAVIVVTEWEEFRRLTSDDFRKHMRHAVIVDGRRIYDPANYSKGIAYSAVGLG